MQNLRFFILLALFSYCFSAQSTAQIDSTLMRFDIKGAQAGKAKLIGMLGEQRFIMDSAVVDAQGKFTLQRKKTLPSGFYYWLLAGGKNFSLLLDRTDQRFSMTGDISDMANTATFEGDALNSKLFYETSLVQMQQGAALEQYNEILKTSPVESSDYIQAKAKRDALLTERDEYLGKIYAKYPDAFFTRFKIAGQNPPVNDFRKANGDLDTLRQLSDYRAHFWDGVDFSDSRLLATPVIANKLKRYVLELTPQNPDSIIKHVDPLVKKVLNKPAYFRFFTNWIALKYENTKTTVMGGEAVYVHIIQNYFKPEYADWDTPENLEKLRKHAWEMEASLLNKKGPDVVAADVITGEMRSIYAIKEPLVVVFMYSPDCEHCQKDAPIIEALYKKWKPKGVEFFGIGVNTETDKLKTFVQDNKFTFHTVHDPTNLAIYAKYFVDITPELYLLDKNRTIVAKNLKPEQLEEVFEREFRKMK